MFEKAQGQFAVSLWDRKTRTLILGRDRVGICPLYYAERDGWLLWGSEIKALLRSGLVDAEPDPKGIDHLFTFFCAGTTRTFFEGVKSIPPGHYLRRPRRPGRAEAATGTSTSPTPATSCRMRRPDAAGRRAGGPAPAVGRASAAGRRAGRQLHQRRARLDGRARPQLAAAGRGGAVVHDRPRPRRAGRAVAVGRGGAGARLAADDGDDGPGRDRRGLPRADRRRRGAGVRHLVRLPDAAGRGRPRRRATRSP